jgi:hypothetical protein
MKLVLLVFHLPSQMVYLKNNVEKKIDEKILFFGRQNMAELPLEMISPFEFFKTNFDPISNVGFFSILSFIFGN